jgi:hypothetical protein
VVSPPPTIAATPEQRTTNSGIFGSAGPFRTLVPAVVGKPIKHASTRGLVARVEKSVAVATSTDSKDEHETNRYNEGSNIRVSRHDDDDDDDDGDAKAAAKEYALKHPPDLFWMMQTIEVDAPMTYVCSHTILYHIHNSTRSTLQRL